MSKVPYVYTKQRREKPNPIYTRCFFVFFLGVVDEKDGIHGGLGGVVGVANVVGDQGDQSSEVSCRPFQLEQFSKDSPTRLWLSYWEIGSILI